MISRWHSDLPLNDVTLPYTPRGYRVSSFSGMEVTVPLALPTWLSVIPFGISLPLSSELRSELLRRCCEPNALSFSFSRLWCAFRAISKSFSELVPPTSCTSSENLEDFLWRSSYGSSNSTNLPSCNTWWIYRAQNLQMLDRQKNVPAAHVYSTHASAQN